MVLISGFIPPEAFPCLLSCLRDSENLTGILAVTLLLKDWLALQYRAERQRRARTMNAGTPQNRH